MAKITTIKTHTSGIPLGGIGSGSVELLSDGEFHYWQIANPPRLTRISLDKKVDDGESSTGALSLTTEKPVVWKDIHADIKLIRDWLEIDVADDFFFLGNLKYVTHGYNILDASPTLAGTDTEKEKNSKLSRLSWCLTHLEVRTTYLKTFDGMLFIPITYHIHSTHSTGDLCGIFEVLVV